MRHDLLNFVWLDINASLGEHPLVEVEGDWNASDVCEAEEFALGRAHDDITEVTDVGGDANVLQVDCSGDVDGWTAFWTLCRSWFHICSSCLL